MTTPTAPAAPLPTVPPDDERAWEECDGWNAADYPAEEDLRRCAHCGERMAPGNTSAVCGDCWLMALWALYPPPTEDERVAGERVDECRAEGRRDAP